MTTPDDSEWLVLTRIAAMFLVMGAGWIARRSGRLDDKLTSTLGRFTIDVAFPALTLTQMIQLVDASSIRSSLPVFALGAAIILIASATGVVAARFLAAPEHRRTFAFLSAIPNWIFLPLPIAQALYGADGVKTVLLINIPAQILLWTLGLQILRGGCRGCDSMKSLLLNPGLIATLTGIALAVLIPSSKAWHAEASIPGAVVQGMVLLGQMTVPLSLIVIGAQLGALDITRPTPWRELGGVLAVRLLIAPLLTVVAVLLASGPLGVSADVISVACIVSAMPVAVSCGLFVERFGGDRDLAARSILSSTLASSLTVPVVMTAVALIGSL